MKSVIKYLLIFIVTNLVIAKLLTLCHYNNIIIVSLIANAIVIAVFIGFRFIRFSTDYITSHPWKELSLCVIAALSMLIPSVFLQEQVPYQLPNYFEDELISLMQSPLGYIDVALLAPITEEIVFRGAILNTLLKWDKLHGKYWLAILISAFLFALIHFNPAQVPHALLMGILLGWVAYSTGSILSTIIIHAVNNSIAYFIVQIYSDPNTKLVDIFGSQQTVGIAMLISLIVLIATIYALNKILIKEHN